MLPNQRLKLKQWRILRELTQDELAEATQITPRTLYNYEFDVNKLRRANYETLERLAKALDISVDNIFLSSNSEKPNQTKCM